ncbi:MAG: TonB-dependent siderophore receptor [Edaphocola sp.]
MKKIFMIFGVMACSMAAHAQNAVVKGKVLNHDGTPAALVSISLDDGETTVQTNNKGEFYLESEAGSHKLKITGAGVQEKVLSINLSPDQNLNLSDITLVRRGKDLNEVVIGGVRSYTAAKTSNSLRLDEPLLQTPQNIQVVTAAALESQMVTSTSDGLLRNVSGLTRLEHWGDMYARVNGRGGRLSAFRNGMNITSAWGPLTEDMAFVDHVEFVKGPAGFMMSYGDPTGLYNTVTKRPEGHTAGEVGIMLGSYDFYRANADVQGVLDRKGKLQFRLNTLAQFKNSFRAYEYNDRVGVAPVLSYQLADRTKLTLEYIYQRAKISNVGSYYVFSPKGYAVLPREFTLMDPGLDPTIINDHNVTLNLEHYIDDNWKITAQASYFNYAQQGSSMWPGAVNADGTIIRRVSIWDALNVMKFGQVYLNGKATTGTVQHKILAGLDVSDKKYLADWNAGYALDTEDSPFDVNNPSYGSPSNGYPNYLFAQRRDSVNIQQRAGIYGIVSQAATSLYLQDEIGFLENKLRLTLAGRYTYVETNSYNTIMDAKRFTPRIGLSYSVDKNTSVYALYDQTFVPQAGLKRDSTHLKPIAGNNMEIGVKRDWFDGDWTTSLTAYRILKNNQSAADPSNTSGESYVIEFGQTKTQGIEFDVRGEIVKGLTLVANYAYTDSKISKDQTESKVGNVVPGYAKHNANAWLSYKVGSGVLKGFGVSAGFNLQADRTTWTWGGTGTDGLPTYFKLDGGLFYETGRVRFTGNLYNITDKYLYSGAAYSAYYYWQAEPGRNWRFGVTYRFL